MQRFALFVFSIPSKGHSIQCHVTHVVLEAVGLEGNDIIIVKSHVQQGGMFSALLLKIYSEHDLKRILYEIDKVFQYTANVSTPSSM